MGFNRIADRDLDARNPRTRGRELPAGRLTVAQAWAAVFVAAAVFEWAAWALNPLCFALSPVALAIVTLYSYATRFTWWSHVWLGFGDATAGPPGDLAGAGRWGEPGWLLWWRARPWALWGGGRGVVAGQGGVFQGEGGGGGWGVAGGVGGRGDMKRNGREGGVMPDGARRATTTRRKGPLPTRRAVPPRPPAHPVRSPTPNRRGR